MQQMDQWSYFSLMISQYRPHELIEIVFLYLIWKKEKKKSQNFIVQNELFVNEKCWEQKIFLSMRTKS